MTTKYSSVQQRKPKNINLTDEQNEESRALELGNNFIITMSSNNMYDQIFEWKTSVFAINLC